VQKAHGKRLLVGILLSGALIILAAVIVFASERFPVGPQRITEIQNERYNFSAHPPVVIQAEAGNLTEYNILAITQTEAWQGYYGNITGTIVLEDEQMYQMYNWTVAEPQGKIFAVNQTVSDWSTVHCLDLYAGADGSTYTYSWDGYTKTTTTTKFLNVTNIENYFGIVYDDDDGINETFRYQRHDQFVVGSINFPMNTCNTTFTYINSTVQTVDFMEALLTVNDSAALIFMTIIETSEEGNQSEQYGFDYRLHDFQMMVLDNGHNGNDLVTPYWFYVEIQ
jgi:hypothetical protein